MFGIRAGGKAGDPISAVNDTGFPNKHLVEIDNHAKIRDPASGPHGELLGKNPREADFCRWMQ
jgi:hypothetical protein